MAQHTTHKDRRNDVTRDRAGKRQAKSDAYRKDRAANKSARLYAEYVR